jgi:hypothetical protein
MVFPRRRNQWSLVEIGATINDFWSFDLGNLVWVAPVAVIS